MRYRIRYSKQGLMKYIGHLDMMRSFQKLLRRTGIDVTFSEGYSPHMVMSYAFPLGVGMTSDSEYVDVDLNRPYPSVELVRRLNGASPEGIHILDAREVPVGKGSKGMTLVARADYTLNFREGHEFPEGWKENFSRFIAQPEIMAVKKGKKTVKEINIAPLIYQAVVDPEPFTVKGIADDADAAEDDSAASGSHENEAGDSLDIVRSGDIFLALSAGSAANIRPELVMETFAKQYGCEDPEHPDPFRFRINRDEVFADTVAGDAEEAKTAAGGHNFVPLIGLGKIIS